MKRNIGIIKIKHSITLPTAIIILGLGIYIGRLQTKNKKKGGDNN